VGHGAAGACQQIQHRRAGRRDPRGEQTFCIEDTDLPSRGSCMVSALPNVGRDQRSAGDTASRTRRSTKAAHPTRSNRHPEALGDSLASAPPLPPITCSYEGHMPGSAARSPLLPTQRCHPTWHGLGRRCRHHACRLPPLREPGPPVPRAGLHLEGGLCHAQRGPDGRPPRSTFWRRAARPLPLRLVRPVAPRPPSIDEQSAALLKLSLSVRLASASPRAGNGLHLPSEPRDKWVVNAPGKGVRRGQGKRE